MPGADVRQEGVHPPVGYLERPVFNEVEIAVSLVRTNMALERVESDDTPVRTSVAGFVDAA